MHVSLLASTSESKDWQSLPRPGVECIEVLRVLVAKECGFGSTTVWSGDHGEAPFPLQEGKHRCNWLGPAKRRVADIGDVIRRPAQSLPRAPVPAVTRVSWSLPRF
jgi:hypothetical protein